MWAFHKHQWTEVTQYTLECRTSKPRHYKERKTPFKGEVHGSGSGMVLTADGPYFDWPWWKRTLSDLAYRPYGTYKGIKGMIWRLTHHPHLLWRYHTHDIVAYVPPGSAYDICSATAQDRVRPIRWAVDMNRLIDSVKADLEQLRYTDC